MRLPSTPDRSHVLAFDRVERWIERAEHERALDADALELAAEHALLDRLDVDGDVRQLGHEVESTVSVATSFWAKRSSWSLHRVFRLCYNPFAMIRRHLLLVAAGLTAFAATYAGTKLWTRKSSGVVPAGMVWMAGGEFTMGTDAESGWPDEKPAHRVRVDGFWIDATEVTNAQFRAFVEATGYVTTAEKPPSLEEIMSQVPPGTPPPRPEDLVPAPWCSLRRRAGLT